MMLRLSLQLGPCRAEFLTPGLLRVRNGTARACIIEIGRELIEASQRVPRGEWGIGLKW